MTGEASARRKVVLGVVFALLGAPVVLALVEAVSFDVANRNNGAIVSSGETREYLLYVPRSHDRTKPTPLVISLHGAAMWPAAQMAVSEWNRVADRQGFIVVYPSGTGLARHKAWQAGHPRGEAKDVRFIKDLIDTLKASHNIDPSRVYADGVSNGAGMAFRLSCALSDRIAAIGMVASAVFPSWESCPDQRPSPTIVFHGTADPIAPYHGGATWVARDNPFADIPAWTAQRAEGNGCEPTPVGAAVAKDVTRTRYKRCRDGADVELYTCLLYTSPSPRD